MNLTTTGKRTFDTDHGGLNYEEPGDGPAVSAFIMAFISLFRVKDFFTVFKIYF